MVTIKSELEFCRCLEEMLSTTQAGFGKFEAKVKQFSEDPVQGKYIHQLLSAKQHFIPTYLRLVKDYFAGYVLPSEDKLSDILRQKPLLSEEIMSNFPGFNSPFENGKLRNDVKEYLLNNFFVPFKILNSGAYIILHEMDAHYLNGNIARSGYCFLTNEINKNKETWLQEETVGEINIWNIISKVPEKLKLEDAMNLFYISVARNIFRNYLEDKKFNHKAPNYTIN